MNSAGSFISASDFLTRIQPVVFIWAGGFSKDERSGFLTRFQTVVFIWAGGFAKDELQ